MGRAAIDMDRGQLLLGSVLRSGYSIQGEQHKNDDQQKRGVFQGCLKPIPMLIARLDIDHGSSACRG